MSNPEQGGNTNAEPFGADGIDPNEQVAPEESIIDVNASQEGMDGEVAPEFDPQKWPLKFRGKTLYPKDRNEAVKWMQQGYGYSNKMNTLNTREAELNERANRYEQLEALQQEWDNNPTFREKILKLRDEVQSPEVAEGQQPDVRAIVQAALEERLNPIIEKTQQAEDDKNLELEITALKSKYPNEKWDEQNEDGKTFLWEIMNHAYQNNHPNLNVAYRDYTYDNVRTNTEAETLKAQADQRAKDAKNGIVTQRGSNQMQEPQKINVREATYSDLAAQAMKEMSS